MTRAPALAFVASSNALSKSLALRTSSEWSLTPSSRAGSWISFQSTVRGSALWIPEHSHAGELGNNFLEQLQPFSSQLRGYLGQPRDVAAGPRQALNKPNCNRVTRRRHNDRDCPGSIFGSQSIGTTGSDDDVNLETDEIGREVGKAIASTLRISILNADVLSLNPSEVAETLPECLVPVRGSGRRDWRKKTYPRDFLRLLRLYR